METNLRSNDFEISWSKKMFSITSRSRLVEVPVSRFWTADRKGRGCQTLGSRMQDDSTGESGLLLQV